MPFVFTIARRYLFAKRSTQAINIISAISILGMCVGAWCLVVFLSVFNGFESLVKSLYNAFYPDIIVMAEQGKTFDATTIPFDKIKAMPGVAAYSLSLEENAFLKYGDKEFIGRIKGVDEAYHHVTAIDSFILFGRYKLTDEKYSYAIVGAAIDQALNVDVDHPMLSLEVMVPKKGRKTYLNPEDAFRKDYLIPAGVFAIQQDFDAKYVLVPLSFAQELLQDENRISSLEIKISNAKASDQVKKKLKELLGKDFAVQDRNEQNAVLFKVMRTERVAVYAILTFIMLIISFNIIGSLSMLVMDKEQDIAILRSLGAGTSMIRNIFLLEGLMGAMFGALLGLILALITCWLQSTFGFVKLQGSGSFVIDAYPVEMHLTDFVLTFLTVVAISFLASWYPAQKAANREITLKYA
jgi:lipoprotein-releasing system permease protein